VTGLYLILDPHVAGGRSLEALVADALQQGVRMFQLRMKTPASGQFYHSAARLCPLIQAAGGRLIVNDRCDVALAVGADGVHLGQDDLPLAEARDLLGTKKLIGISTHTLAQALEAEAAGADYIGFGPIFATASKAQPDPVVGVRGLKEVRARTRVPIVAIGGITAGNVKEVLAAGADAAAVLSAVMAARDPVASVVELVRRIREAQTGPG
jgi:thiamine-phosphate pyrophosphorylase